MQNVTEYADLDTTVDVIGMEEANVLECAVNHVKNFETCDTPLHGSKPWDGLLPKVETRRGAPSLTPKGKIEYPVDVSEDVPVFVVPGSFPKYQHPRLRFFSVYAESPQPAEGSAIWVKRFTPEAPRTRVERVVSHPVAQGCMRQSGVEVYRAGRRGSSTTEELPWNLYWGARFKDEAKFRTLEAFQRVNHFPGTWLLGRKDNLAKQIRSHQLKAKIKPVSKEFDFVPVSYTIPNDLKLLSRDIKEGHIFIAKPPASACGRGIFLFGNSVPKELMDAKNQTGSDKQSDDDDDNEYLVQRYLPNPLLLNGFKVDLRLYVAVTSFDPLRVYLFNDGLVRFASEPYPADPGNIDLGNVFAHLTNYSINKKSENYIKTSSAEEDGSGSKWTLHALRKYFEAHSLDWSSTWKRIQETVLKTLIACEEDVCSKLMQTTRHRSSCFELYGFDIMLDNRLKPYLIEVNVMPSLACASALDKHVKGHLVADVMTLAGIPFQEDDGSTLREANQAYQSVKSEKGEFNDPRKYFETKVTAADKQMIRDSEDELSRCGGFARLLPDYDTAATFGPLFTSKRHFNELLWHWEVVKSKFTPPEMLQAVQWLNDEAPFPGKKMPPKQVSSNTPIQRKRTLSSSRVAKGRLSASPRHQNSKVVLPAAPQRAPINVCTFQFIDVKK